MKKKIWGKVSWTVSNKKCLNKRLLIDKCLTKEEIQTRRIYKELDMDYIKEIKIMQRT